MSRLASVLLLVFAFPLLIRAGDREDAFFAAARKGDAKALAKLLDEGVDVNAKTAYGATALHYACDRGHLDVVKLLLKHKANPERGRQVL